MAVGVSIIPFLCCLASFLWVLLAIPIFWRDVIRNYRFEKNLKLAFRQRFFQVVSDQSFNVDDVLLTLKSVLPFVIYSIRDTLKENDLPVQSLDDFEAAITNVNNIQNIYGSYNAVAGSGGTAAANVSQSSEADNRGAEGV